MWWFYGGLHSYVVFLSGSLVVLRCRGGFVVVLIGFEVAFVWFCGGSKWLFRSGQLE